MSGGDYKLPRYFDEHPGWRLMPCQPAAPCIQVTNSITVLVHRVFYNMNFHFHLGYILLQGFPETTLLKNQQKVLNFTTNRPKRVRFGSFGWVFPLTTTLLYPAAVTRFPFLLPFPAQDECLSSRSALSVDALV